MVGKKTHLFIAQIQELVKLNSTVGEGTEGPLLLEVGGDLRVGNGGVSLQQPKHRIVIIASRERKEQQVENRSRINRQHFVLF